MHWPGATNDYMMWVTSALCWAFKDNNLTKKVLVGFTFVGDNAYLKRLFMAVPFKGVWGGYNITYTVYLS